MREVAREVAALVLFVALAGPASLASLAGLAGLTGLSACGGGKSARAPRGDAGPGGLVRPEPAGGGDAGLRAEIDAAPIAPADVLEGPAAAAAMAAGRGADAGAVPDVAPGVTLRDDGVGAYRLDLPRDELVPLLGAARLTRLPPSPTQPDRELAVLREGALPWLEIEVCGGRVCRLTVGARTIRALTDEGIGVGSTAEELILAHGRLRPVMRGAALAGWVAEDRPGLLWELAPPGTPEPADDAPDDAPDGGVVESARVRRVSVLGAEALSAPD